MPAADTYPTTETFRPPNGWFRALMPGGAWVLTGVAGILSVLSVMHAAGDPRGEGGILSWFILPATLPTAWAVIQTVWARYGNVPAIYLSLTRTVVVPLIAAPIIALIGAATVLTPAVADTITATTNPVGFHYYFSADDGHPAYQVLLLGGLGNTFIAMLAGLAITVVIVIPWYAFARPRQFIDANNYDTSDDTIATNTLASRTLAIFLILTFAIPALIVFGSREATARDLPELWGTWHGVFTDPDRYLGDGLWMLGIALIPIGLATMIITAVAQRKEPPAPNSGE